MMWTLWDGEPSDEARKFIMWTFCLNILLPIRRTHSQCDALNVHWSADRHVTSRMNMMMEWWEREEQIGLEAIVCENGVILSSWTVLDDDALPLPLRKECMPGECWFIESYGAQSRWYHPTPPGYHFFIAGFDFETPRISYIVKSCNGNRKYIVHEVCFTG